MGGRNSGVESNITAQIEFVRHLLQITQSLRLACEVLTPIPFIEQFLRERIAVAVGFGIEPRAGIAIPVPGAADIATSLKHSH